MAIGFHEATTSRVQDEGRSAFQSQKDYASDNDWERHREEIGDLYIRQDLHLKDVRRIMEQRHSFRGTERMYKTRLRKWGFFKNQHHRNSPDAERVDDVPADLEQAIPITTPVPNPQRNKATRGRCPGLDLRSNSPIRRVLVESSGYLRTADHIVYAIRTYVESALENKVWTLHHFRTSLVSRGDSSTHERLNDWDSAMTEAIYLILKNQLVEGFRVLNLCFDRMIRILRDQDPELLSNMTWFILQIPPENRDLLAIVLGYFHNTSDHVLGSSHPVTVFWTCCRAMDQSDAYHFVRLAMETMIVSLEAKTGLTQASFSIQRRLIKFSTKSRLTTPSDSQVQLRALIARGHGVNSSQMLDEAVIRAGIDLCTSLQETSHLDEAMQVLLMLARWLELKRSAMVATDSHTFVRLMYEYTYALLRLYTLAMKFHDAIEVSEKLLKFCEERYGALDGKTVCALEKHVQMLISTGRVHEAMALRRMWESRAGRIQIGWY